MINLLTADADPSERLRALANARAQYVWDKDYLPPLPMLRLLRDADAPVLGVAEFLVGEFTVLPEPERPDDSMPTERLEATLPGMVTLEADKFESLFGRLKQPNDYDKLLRSLHVPVNLAGNLAYDTTWDQDAMFGWQRLAGPNPMTLARPDDAGWSVVQAKLQLTDAHVKAVLGDSASVDGARRAGLLAISDYPMLTTPTPLPCGTTEGRRKYLPAPCAAFLWHPERDALLPAAIRMGQQPTDPLFVPDGSDRWAAAKAQFGVADFDFHEMAVHLSLVHFLQEGFAVALARGLPPQHPVHALLVPHFKYLLFNNFAGRELLVEEGGYVEKILSTDLRAGSLELVCRAYRAFHFDDLDVPMALAARGMMSLTGLPVFPYRDDGLLLWAAIDTWTRSYVAAYYPDDASVEADTELAGWCHEMTSADGAHVNGFPEAFHTRDRLANALTRLIFLAGPQHAAVNYAQHNSMLVVPNMSGAAWSADPDHLMDVLPPLLTAHTQVEAIWLLTCYQYGRLGEYGASITDPRVLGAMNVLHQHLAMAESTIHERNLGERNGREYLYLKPSRVPNSSNI